MPVQKQRDNAWNNGSFLVKLRDKQALVRQYQPLSAATGIYHHSVLSFQPMHHWNGLIDRPSSPEMDGWMGRIARQASKATTAMMAGSLRLRGGKRKSCRCRFALWALIAGGKGPAGVHASPLACPPACQGCIATAMHGRFRSEQKPVELIHRSLLW